MFAGGVLAFVACLFWVQLTDGSDLAHPAHTGPRLIRDRMRPNADRIALRNLAPETLAAMRNEVSADLAQMQALVTSAGFDFGLNQRRELARTRRLTRQIEGAAATFYSQLHQLRDTLPHASWGAQSKSPSW